LKHNRATDEIQELAALYALGSLSQREARSFELHLQEGCASCEAELNRFENTVAGIGLSTAEVEPPEYLRDLLSARIEREPQDEIPSGAASAGTLKEHASEIRPAPTKPAPGRPVFAPPHQQRTSYLPWALAAALAVVAALAFHAYRQSEAINLQLQQKAVSAEGDSENLRMLLSIQQEKSRKFEEIRSILSASGAKAIVLAGRSPDAPSLSAVWDAGKNLCLIAGSMQPPPEGKAYQIWFAEGTQRVSPGLLQADSEGRVLMFVELPPEITRLDSVLITLEPAGGSKQPTTMAVALGRVG
jgi:anti-sigma-K factor RskA